MRGYHPSYQIVALVRQPGLVAALPTQVHRDVRAPSGRLATTADVPRISEFYGIGIEMYFRDHRPPHFHARYAGEEAVVEIATGEVLAGSIPRRAQRLVREWTEIHREELGVNWERARARQAPEPIEPLR